MTLPDPLFVRLRERFAGMLPADTPAREALAAAMAEAAVLEAGPDFHRLHTEAEERDARLAATLAAGDAMYRHLDDDGDDGPCMAAWLAARSGGDPIVLHVEDDVLVVARPGLRMYDSSDENPLPPVMVLMPAWIADALAHLLAVARVVLDALGCGDADAYPRPELAEALHLAHDLSEGRSHCSGWTYDGPLAELAARLVEPLPAP